MRYFIGFVCVLALGVMPMVGCNETTGDGGSGGMAGSGGTGGMPDCQSPEDCDDFNDCTGNACADGMCEYTPLADGTACDESNDCITGVCADGECDTTPVQDGTACGNGVGTCQLGMCSNVACTEQGIRDAIAAGGGPYTFDCDGPTTIVTHEWLVIDKDVILDGEGNITLDGNEEHPVLGIYPAEGGDPSTVELRGFQITGAEEFGTMNVGYAIYVFESALTLTDCAVSDNKGDGIQNQGGTLTLSNSTVSGSGFTHVANYDGGTLWVTNSTISGGEVGISNGGQMTISNSTVVSTQQAFRTPGAGYVPPPAAVFANTMVVGGCEGGIVTHVTSNGYNIESPGDTCGFDPDGTDQVNVPDPMLGPLQANGGQTETHALLPGSPAIDKIPEADCGVSTDQRGEPRPEMGGDACDVGAFERQPDDQ